MSFLICEIVWEEGEGIGRLEIVQRFPLCHQPHIQQPNLIVQVLPLEFQLEFIPFSFWYDAPLTSQ